MEAEQMTVTSAVVAGVLGEGQRDRADALAELGTLQ